MSAISLLLINVLMRHYRFRLSFTGSVLVLSIFTALCHFFDNVCSDVKRFRVFHSFCFIIMALFFLTFSSFLSFFLPPSLPPFCLFGPVSKCRNYDTLRFLFTFSFSFFFLSSSVLPCLPPFFPTILSFFLGPVSNFRNYRAVRFLFFLPSSLFSSFLSYFLFFLSFILSLFVVVQKLLAAFWITFSWSTTITGQLPLQNFPVAEIAEYCVLHAIIEYSITPDYPCATHTDIARQHPFT